MEITWDSREAFFTRCMANSGIQVTNVEVEFLGDDMSLGFTPADMSAENINAVSERCTDELLRLYSRTPRPDRDEGP